MTAKDTRQLAPSATLMSTVWITLFLFIFSPMGGALGLDSCVSGDLLKNFTPVQTHLLYDAALLNDGEKPLEGDSWVQGGTTIFRSPEGFAIWDLGRAIELRSYLIQGDNNDFYSIDTSQDGSSWARFGSAAPVPMPGMRTRIGNTEATVARFVKVSAGGGDGKYSIGEIGVSCENVFDVNLIDSRGFPARFFEPIARKFGGEWFWIFAAACIYVTLLLGIALYRREEGSSVGRESLWEIYFLSDLRSLSFFRICLASTLLLDLWERFSVRELFYYQDGLFPPAMTLKDSYFPFPLTVFHFAQSNLFIEFFFCACCVAYCALLIGYRTKWAQIATFVAVVSVHEGTIFGHSGHCVLRILAFLTIVLPLGEYFSFDRYLGRIRTSRTVTHSPMVLVLLLQLAAIYFLNVLHKFSPLWMDGSFVPLILWDDTVVHQLGAWARQSLPGWMLTWTTYVTLCVEACAPFLLLSPIVSAPLRIISIISLIALHLGIGLMMHIPVFSLAMITFLTCMLPRSVWKRWDNPRSTACPDAQDCRPSVFANGIQWGLAGFVLILFSSQIIEENEPFTSTVGGHFPSSFSKMIQFGRFRQSWCMFGSCGNFSNVPSYITAISECEGVDGGTIDILRSAFNGESVRNPSSLVYRPVPIYSEMWAAYQVGVASRDPRVLNQLTRWIERQSQDSPGALHCVGVPKTYLRYEPITRGHLNSETEPLTVRIPLPD